MGRSDPTADGAAPVAIINETMARRFWPGADPLGARIQLGVSGPLLEIIGVARDIKYYSVAEAPQPYVYLPFAQRYPPGLTFHVRAAGEPAALVPEVIRAVQALDPKVAVDDAMTFAELRQAPLFSTRAMALVSSLFGGFALLLTALGLYGVLSYTVALRTREIGIRLALGARPQEILTLFVGRGLGLALVGVGVGLAASAAVTRLLAAWLFGVTPTDPAVFASIAALLVVVAAAASYVPARRATQVDPVVALRAQ